MGWQKSFFWFINSKWIKIDWITTVWSDDLSWQTSKKIKKKLSGGLFAVDLTHLQHLLIFNYFISPFIVYYFICSPELWFITYELWSMGEGPVSKFIQRNVDGTRLHMDKVKFPPGSNDAKTSMDHGFHNCGMLKSSWLFEALEIQIMGTF